MSVFWSMQHQDMLREGCSGERGVNPAKISIRTSSVPFRQPNLISSLITRGVLTGQHWPGGRAPSPHVSTGHRGSFHVLTAAYPLQKFSRRSTGGGGVFKRAPVSSLSPASILSCDSSVSCLLFCTICLGLHEGCCQWRSVKQVALPVWRKIRADIEYFCHMLLTVAVLKYHAAFCTCALTSSSPDYVTHLILLFQTAFNC